MGIFADGTYGGVAGLIVGDVHQVAVQLLTMAVVTVWALGTGYILFALLKSAMGLRVSRREEEMGLDLTEHGMECYPGERLAVKA